MSPEEFINQVLEQLNLKYLRVGDDLDLKDRAGGFNMLTDWGQSSMLKLYPLKRFFLKIEESEHGSERHSKKMILS